MDNKKKTIEIYALAKNLESVSVETNDNVTKVTLDLSQPQEESKKLKEANLMPPIREAEKFKDIKGKKYAEQLKLNGQADDNLDRIIAKGDKAVNDLMEIFWPSAYNFAKNWVHNDRLNKNEDWNQIIRMALYNAILNFDLDMQTQFNTFLKYQIRCSCKEEKCNSSIVAVNPSAMHKALTVQKAKQALINEGKDENDLDELANKLNRDISTDNKRENFRKMLIDMDNVSPQAISTEASVDSSSRTFGESLQSDNTLDPLEMLEVTELKKKITEYYAFLDDETKECLRQLLGQTPKKDIPHLDKCMRRLKTQKFHKLLDETTKYKEYGINFLDFIGE